MADLYHERNKNLRKLGFRSYAKYLNSTLWRRIKKRLFKDRGYVCQRCRDEGDQIHHRDYSIETLNGDSLEALVVLCRECHEFVEFEGGKKVSPERANERLDLPMIAVDEDYVDG